MMACLDFQICHLFVNDVFVCLVTVLLKGNDRLKVLPDWLNVQTFSTICEDDLKMF